MEKVDARSLSLKAQERLRQLAVNAVFEGKKQVEVAKLFGVTRRAVSNWLKAYCNGGLPALKAKAKGRPIRGIIRTVAGGSNWQNGDRPSPGTAQVAFLPLDPRSGGQFITQAIKLFP